MKKLIFREDGKIELTDNHNLLFMGEIEDFKLVDNGEAYEEFKIIIKNVVKKLDYSN